MLYLSVTGITFDGGAACDPDCIPSITAAATLSAGGGETACEETTGIWLVAPAGAGTAEFSTLKCQAGGFSYESQGLLVNDAGGKRICATYVTSGLSAIRFIGEAI